MASYGWSTKLPASSPGSESVSQAEHFEQGRDGVVVHTGEEEDENEESNKADQNSLKG